MIALSNRILIRFSQHIFSLIVPALHVLFECINFPPIRATVDSILWVHIEVSVFIYIYISWTHLIHSDSLLTTICHNNWPTYALFQLLQPLIFKPLCLFGKHTLSHATKGTFFLSALLPHRKSLHIWFTWILWGRMKIAPRSYELRKVLH